MTKYRYEFKDSDFEPGNCPECPLGYVTSDAYGYNAVACVLGCLGIECPLEEVEERKIGKWVTYGETEICSVCKLPWDYGMQMNGDDIGYFDPMPDYCPHCGADMRGEQE